MVSIYLYTEKLAQIQPSNELKFILKNSLIVYFKTVNETKQNCSTVQL